MRLLLLIDPTKTCCIEPGLGDLGIEPGACLINFEDAAKSAIVARMNTHKSNQMPPLASSLVDDDGLQLVSDWISSLQGCIR
jgi:hypothetical protein